MRATLPDNRLLRALAYAPRRLYEAGVRLRSALYETGRLRSVRLDRPVVSVGNLTFGGTGKTPLVEVIATALVREGLRVVVLTRGHGRRGKGRVVLRAEAEGDAVDRGGDEPALLARRVPGAVVVVDADRRAAGRWAEREIDPDVFVLDDGFQHLRVARDLNLLVVDATNPFGGMEMAPFGTLREPLGAMRRADAVVITRAGRAHDLDLVVGTIREACGDRIPIVRTDHQVRGFVPLGGGPMRPAGSLRGQSAGVLAALGNPAVLLDDLARADIRVAAARLLPDHHDYSRRDLDDAIAASRARGASVLLTTGKDAVKLERLGATEIPILVVEIELNPSDREPLERLCLEAVRRTGRDRRT
jgi:tetraacyldisaccharide 4'-kinase